MPTIGEKLRGARTALGLTLEEVSASTRINPKNLRALEADDRAAFSAAFFYKSFVTQYANFLYLSDPEIPAQLERILAAQVPLPLPGQAYQAGLAKKIAPMPSAHRGASLDLRKLAGSFASFVFVLAACSGIYAFWRDSNRAPHPAPPPLRILASHPAPAAPAAKATPALAAPVPAPAAPPQTSGLSLNLAAKEATWLSVSSDGKRVFRGVLQPNQSKALAAEAHARLIVGNAGGLNVEWNGRDLGPLGRRGQVRVVTFTAEGYKFQPNPD